MADDDWLSAAAEPEPAAAPGGGSGPANEPVDLLKDYVADAPSKKAKRDHIEQNPVYKVWKRPVFQQYSYLHDYRHNYYDDVIDYMNIRQRGYSCDIPRPQTWAERALRTYTRHVHTTAAYEKRVKDISLLSDIRTCIRFYNHHSKEYLAHKYS